MWLSLLSAFFFATNVQAQTTTLHGKVLDSRTGEAIAKATVSIRGRKIETRTNDNGEFELTEVAPGEIELYVTTVGYSLVRKKIEVTAGIPVELEVLLGPEILRRTDEVTVTEKVFVEPEPAAVSDHTLTQAEMKNLSSVLVDDPLRSVQALPGVTTGDDFFAQFSARGAGFRSIGYSTDGILIYSPMHEVGDVNDGGSLSMLNGDVIESVTLQSGGFSSKYGDRTGGYLSILTRDGNRQRFTNTGTAGAAGLGWTSEGPIGKSHRASWLLSARKSYLDYLVNKLSDDPSSTFIFGFYDFFGKLAFEPTTRHQLRLSGNFGKSRVDERRDPSFGINNFLFGDSRSSVGIADWLWILSNNFTLDSAISYDNALLKNVNHDRALLFHSDLKQLAIKQDAAYQPRASNRIETGYFIRRLSQETERRRFQFSSQQFRRSDLFSASAWQPAAYVQHTVTGLNSRLAFTYGVRFERLNLTGQNIWMPRASAAFSILPDTKITLAFGQYSQFPSFRQFFGEFGNLNLKAERATDYTLEVEQLLNDKTRIRLEIYDREDRNGIYSADTEYRLVNGQAVGPQPGFPGRLQNNLRGHARGAEIFVQRRSVNKLSGWVSYSYGVARYRDAATNLSFYGDYDQRHTFNVYATYRFRPSLNLSAKYRYGSNFPIAGFLRFEDSRVRLSDQRNLARIPTYSRLDIRANKSFNFDRWKLTLYGEVLNVLRHRNIRYTSEVDTVNGRVSVSRDSMFPLLPIAGVRIEF
jgi:hypothetical protein